MTADSLEFLRRRIRGSASRGRRGSRQRRGRHYMRLQYGRWSLLQAQNPQSDPVEAKARQLLRRYGLLFPELLAREPMAPRWRDLVRILRRLEARGEIRGGRFVAGFVGEQFALQEAVEMLRKVNKSEPAGRMVAVSACDPLNVAGILTPGKRVPAVLGNKVAFRDGAPLFSVEKGLLVDRASLDESALAQARSLLRLPTLRATDLEKTLTPSR